MRGLSRIASIIALFLIGAVVQNSQAVAPYGGGATESTFNPAQMQIDENRHLGAPMDKELLFIGEDGKEFSFGDVLDKPVILLLSYYGCDGTCPLINAGLKQALMDIDRFKIGKDYQVITVSFDKQDNMESTKAFVEKVGIPENLRQGWSHAVLKDPDKDIAALTASLGFRFFWSKADQVFVHPNVVVFITPEGRVARYLYGTSLEKREIELALVDADWNRISNSNDVIDMLAGVCYSYNYAEGKYTYNYSLLVGVASLLFGLSLVAFSAIGYQRKKVGRLSHV